MGHANVSITQDVYTTLFDKHANNEETRGVLDAEMAGTKLA